jgi:AbiV family abortive infection protein
MGSGVIRAEGGRLLPMKPLTVAEIEDARKATADTAISLVSAAALMLDAGYPAISFFLSHAACEEIAKIPMLVGVGLDIVAGRVIDWKEVGRRLESHREKLAQTWISLHINANEAFDDPTMLAKARTWFAADGPAVTLREHSLYAGVISMPNLPTTFRAPADVIDESRAFEGLAISRAIVDNRVRQEELSRGNLARTPPGFVDAVERHVAALQERHKEQG